MKVYRCSGCGYLHVGEAPEVCPMCGAKKSAFKEYQVPDLTGTKTYDNLAAAFAGESQANRKYTLWQQIAKLEGKDEAAKAFDRPLAEETAHALSHAAYMGLFDDTATNLENAAEGERYESEEMYPAFAKTAEEEGFPELAAYFKALARYEGEHMQGYLQARKAL
jgi:rubrerythrin